MGFTIRRAGHVVLRVTDPFLTREFFERILGFQTSCAQTESFFLMTANPVSNHHMIAVRDGKTGERLPDPEHHIGMISIAYEVTSPEALRDLQARIRDEGPRYGFTIVGTEDRGTTENVIVRDRDGNQLEFYCTLPSTACHPERSRGTAQPASTLSPVVRRTSHLLLRCADLAASRTFYERALNLAAIAESGGRVYLSGDPASGRPVLALEQAPDLNVPRPTPRTMYGLEHFSMEVGSFAQLQAAYAHLASTGVHVHHTMDHGVTNSIYLTDPDGNLIEIYHDVARAEYRNPESPFGSFGPIEDRLAVATH